MVEFGDGDVLAAFPTAAIDYDNIEFYRGQLQRRFLVNRCENCGHSHTPPRSVCVNCWSRDLKPTEIGGTGTVYMLVRLHDRAPGGEASGVETLATVELDEQPGLRITTVLIGVSPDEPCIGMEVELDWIDDGEIPRAMFRPRRSEST